MIALFDCVTKPNGRVRTLGEGEKAGKQNPTHKILTEGFAMVARKGRKPQKTQESVMGCMSRRTSESRSTPQKKNSNQVPNVKSHFKNKNKKTKKRKNKTEKQPHIRSWSLHKRNGRLRRITHRFHRTYKGNTNRVTVSGSKERKKKRVR
jgi:hypothetical protein